MEFHYIKTENGASVAAFVDGKPLVADDTHPNWRQITQALKNDEDPTEYFSDPARAVRESLSEYTDRVTIENEQVLVDGEVITGVLPSKILRAHREGKTVKPLVLFLENLQDNPSHRSREQLFTYLDQHDFQITEDGAFIAYKGIRRDGKSSFSGTAFVNGVKINGRIPYSAGDVVTMPRNKISDDPNVACHAGLHAGAWSYASSFGDNGCTLKVKIFPQHVVSVPADSSVQKIRTERLEVLEKTVKELPDEVYYGYDDWDDGYDEGFNAGYEAAIEDQSKGAWL